MRNKDEPPETAIDDENRRVRTLQVLVDFALAYISQTDVSITEARAVVEGVRRHALRLFPDKEEAFELIYLPRFRRLLQEKYQLH